MEIPEEFRCVNGFKVSGLTSFCILLKRFAYPCRYMDIMPRFAMSVPQLSIISNLSMNFVYDNWGHLLRTFDQEWLSPANLQGFANTVHVVHVYGPIEGKRHDSTMLARSGLMDLLDQHSRHQMEPTCIYGDPAYTLMSATSSSL